jgi:chaperonin GroES
MNFKPLFDRVLIKADPVKETSAGGIIFAETHVSPFQEGEIVAVGQGFYDSGKMIPLIVKVGDRVKIVKSPGREIDIEGETYVLMQEKDILGIVT